MNSKLIISLLYLFVVFFLTCNYANAQEDRGYKIFQFPADQIPRIDGNSSDWDIYPDGYIIGTDQLVEDEKGLKMDPQNLDIKVRVGWVKGMNRLYFLYEAYDNYWDFSGTGLRNDTYEIVIDGDMSGGPLIDEMHPNKDMDRWDAYFSYHGVHAQNYHVFTPAEGKEWTMVWGSEPWIKDLPWANAAYNYNFKHGEAGKLTLEFWVTAFDYAGNDPSRAVESKFYDNKKIGLSWAVIDYDDWAKNEKGFWNLSKFHTMYGNASQLLTFQLMPLEQRFRKSVEANWSFKVLDMDKRLVAFKDESFGKITSWKWEFGDSETSEEQNPQHNYKNPGKYVVVLYIEGPDGKSQRSKVWDVAVK